MGSEAAVRSPWHRSADELFYTETRQVINRDAQRDGEGRRSLEQTVASPARLISNRS